MSDELDEIWLHNYLIYITNGPYNPIIIHEQYGYEMEAKCKELLSE